MTGNLVSDTAASIAERWAEAKRAHAAFIAADGNYDAERNAIYAHHGSDIAAGIRGVHDELVEASDNADDAVGNAHKAHERARSVLRATIVESLGADADPLVDELYKAIDACYEPSGTRFNERITGARGEERDRAVAAAREKINELAGTPVLQ